MNHNVKLNWEDRKSLEMCAKSKICKIYCIQINKTMTKQTSNTITYRKIKGKKKSLESLIIGKLNKEIFLQITLAQNCLISLHFKEVFHTQKKNRTTRMHILPFLTSTI
jgi:hypothetical protein